MERLSLAFLTLLHQVSVGSLIPLLFLKGVGKRGFLKLIAFTSLSLEGIALGIQLLALRQCSVFDVGCWMFDPGVWSLGSGVLFFLLLAIFTALLFIRDERKSPLFLRFTLLVGGSVLCFAAVSFLPSPVSYLPSLVLLLLSFFTSALLLGSVVVAMLLGHWYLVEPGLSIGPFKRLAALYLGSCLLQGLVVLGSALFAFFGGPSSKMTLATYPYALIGRIGLGVFIPLAIGALVWETLKIPHTQAATGLLYVAIVLVLAGELLGRYLLAISFIPL
ncbi:MAG: hypothetical protein ACK4Z6_07440 [Candidatus Methylomirabilales bacterium]